MTSERDLQAGKLRVGGSRGGGSREDEDNGGDVSNGVPHTRDIGFRSHDLSPRDSTAFVRRTFGLRAALVLTLAAGVVAAGSQTRTLHGYGLSLTLASGWRGSVTPGEIAAIAPSGAVLQLDEAFVSPQRYVRLPNRVRPGTTRLYVETGGRKLFLWVHTTAARLAETNRVLASVRAAPWTAPLAAPRFRSSPGWQAGRSGPQPSPPRWYVSAWASTIPYENGPMDLPPDDTLAHAGARDVVVWVGLHRPRRRNPFPVRRDPLDLQQATCTASWEGGIPGVTQCTLWSQVPGLYEVDVYVYLRDRTRLAAASASCEGSCCRRGRESDELLAVHEQAVQRAEQSGRAARYVRQP